MSLSTQQHSLALALPQRPGGGPGGLRFSQTGGRDAKPMPVSAVEGRTAALRTICADVLSPEGESEPNRWRGRDQSQHDLRHCWWWQSSACLELLRPPGEAEGCSGLGKM